MSNFIADGQIFEASVDPVVGETFASVKIRYRPVSWVENETIREKLGSLPPSKAGAEVCKFLAGKITWWDIEHDGIAVEITESNMQKLRGNLVLRLYSAIVDAQGEEVDASVGN